MLPCKFPEIELFIFWDGVVFADMDDLAAHITWYFGSGLGAPLTWWRN